jgi:hypothetical protein
MAERDLIHWYNDVLRSELPSGLAEEVADGLAEANAKYLRHGLSAADAAAATVAEFGDPRAIVNAFVQDSAARRVARALVATGPAVGLCWAAALIVASAWDWRLPVATPVALGMMLTATIIVLLTALLGHRYSVVHRAGIAGCLGLGVVDISVITSVAVVAPSFRGLLLLAASASTVRLVFVARALRPVLA